MRRPWHKYTTLSMFQLYGPEKGRPNEAEKWNAAVFPTFTTERRSNRLNEETKLNDKFELNHEWDTFFSIVQNFFFACASDDFSGAKKISKHFRLLRHKVARKRSSTLFSCHCMYTNWNRIIHFFTLLICYFNTPNERPWQLKSKKENNFSSYVSLYMRG